MDQRGPRTVVEPIEPVDDEFPEIPEAERVKILEEGFFTYREDNADTKIPAEKWLTILRFLITSHHFYVLCQMILKGTARLGHAVFVGLQESVFSVNAGFIYLQFVEMTKGMADRFQLYLRTKLGAPGRDMWRGRYVLRYQQAWRRLQSQRRKFGIYALLRFLYVGITAYTLQKRNWQDLWTIALFYLRGNPMALHVGAVYSTVHDKVIGSLRELARDGHVTFRANNPHLWVDNANVPIEVVEEENVEWMEEEEEEEEEEGDGDGDDQDRDGDQDAASRPDPQEDNGEDEEPWPDPVDPAELRDGLPLLITAGMSKEDITATNEAVVRTMLPFVAAVRTENGIPVLVSQSGSSTPSSIRTPLALSLVNNGHLSEGWIHSPINTVTLNVAYTGGITAFDNPVPIPTMLNLKPLLNIDVCTKGAMAILYRGKGEVANTYLRSSMGRKHAKIPTSIFQTCLDDETLHLPLPIEIHDLASLPPGISTILMIGSEANEHAASRYRFEPFPGHFVVLAFVTVDERVVLLVHAPSARCLTRLSVIPRIALDLLHYLSLFHLIAASAMMELPRNSTSDTARGLVFDRVKAGFGLAPEMLDPLMALGHSWAFVPRNLASIDYAMVQAIEERKSHPRASDGLEDTTHRPIREAVDKVLEKRSNILPIASAWSRADPVSLSLHKGHGASAIIPRANSIFDSPAVYLLSIGTGDPIIFYDDNLDLKEIHAADPEGRLRSFSLKVKMNRDFYEDTKARISIQDDDDDAILSNTLFPHRLGRPIPPDTEMFSCEQCSAVFKDPQGLAKHTCKRVKLVRRELAAQPQLAIPPVPAAGPSHSSAPGPSTVGVEYRRFIPNPRQKEKKPRKSDTKPTEI